MSRFDPLPNPADQPRHTRLVTSLLNSSCGDLMLDHHGDLCTRDAYDHTTWASLPWDQHKPGQKLAVINRFGWALTWDGAEYILANQIYDKRDLKFLRAVQETTPKERLRA